mgnify:CR=1 FL=1
MIEAKTMDAKPLCVSKGGWGAYTGSESKWLVGPFLGSSGPVSFLSFFGQKQADRSPFSLWFSAGLTYSQRHDARRPKRRAPWRERPRPALTWQGYQGGPHGLA